MSTSDRGPKDTIPSRGTSSISAEYPFRGRVVEVLDSTMHYVDEGTGLPILLLHGNPTWSYVWRNVIPHLVDRGRVIAPDLIGMGRSGKPDIEYRFVDHARYLDAFISTLGLEDVVLVVQDWGAVLGFHYARRHESNVRGIAFMEGNVDVRRSWDEFDEPLRELFRRFRTPGVGWDLIGLQNVFIEQALPAGVVRCLSAEEMAFYREPYLDPEARKPVWRWPNELPIAGEPTDVVEVVEAYRAWLQRTSIPKLLLYAEPGVILTAPHVAWCRANLPNLDAVFLGPGLHFLQEDHPDAIGRAIAAWHDRI